MKSLKRTVRNSRLKTHNVVSAWLKPRMEAIGSRYRLAARIRKANGWAAKHPRRTFAYVVGTLLLVLVADVAFTLTRTETAEPELDMIANVEPIFNGFRTIQANKDVHRRTILDLASRGQSVRAELDSMVAIPVKSREDSIGIILRYNQLENIVKSLKQNDND